MLSRSANLGDTRTIVTHPASTTHSKLTEDERLAVGITPGLIRIAVGLEHHEDIIGDVERGLGWACFAVQAGASDSNWLKRSLVIAILTKLTACAPIP